MASSVGASYAAQQVAVIVMPAGFTPEVTCFSQGEHRGVKLSKCNEVKFEDEGRTFEHDQSVVMRVDAAKSVEQWTLPAQLFRRSNPKW